MDSYLYQKKIKEEQKLKRKNPNDFNETDYSFMFLIGAGILVFTIAIILMGIADANNRNSCENIGGEYLVVDQEYTGKAIVDVYGCVK